MGIALELPGAYDDPSKYEKYGHILIKDSSDDIESYEQGRLTAIARYYAENYNETIARRISYMEGMDLAKSIKGWNKIERNFTVKTISIGGVYPFTDSLYINLLSRNKECVRGFIWYNPIEHGNPMFNWTKILDIFEKTNRAICKKNWIFNWLKSGKEHILYVSAYGLFPHADETDYQIAKKAWQESGLSGIPYYQIAMMDGDNQIGNFYMSEDGENSIIIRLKKSAGSSWLNQQEFSYFPTSTPRTFIVVDKKGNWKKYEIKNKDALM